MTKILHAVRVGALAMLAFSLAAWSQSVTFTPNVGLPQIPNAYPNWGPVYNTGELTTDTVFGQLQAHFQGAWASGTTYAKGQEATVLVGTVSTLYVSLQNSNTGHAPSTSPTYWSPMVSSSGAVTFESIDPCSPQGAWPFTFVALACDNSTDDSVALQALLTSVVASTTPVDIELPALSIKLTRQIVINNPAAPLRIHGQGIASALNFTAEDVHGSGLIIENSTKPVVLDNLSIKGTTFTALSLLYDTGGTQLSNSYISGGAQGTGDAGMPAAGMQIQGGQRILIDNTVFTANGPQTGSTSCTDKSGAAVICPKGYTLVSNYEYFSNNIPGSLTNDLIISNSRFYGNNNVIGLSGFDMENTAIVNNFVDQGNAFLNDTTPDAELPQGYGIMSYGSAHINSSTGTFSAIARASNVVTVTLTSGTLVPYTVGQWICVASSALGSTNGTQFAGCWPVASVTGSGGSTPQFTYSQVGADDTLSGIPDIVNSNVGVHIVGNNVRNASGSCVYMQGGVDSAISTNQLFNCGQMMDAHQIPVGGIICNGCTRVSIAANEVNGAVNINPVQIGGETYRDEGIAIFNAFDSTATSNTVYSFDHSGISLGSNIGGVTVGSNTIDGAGLGSFGILVNAMPWNRVAIDHNTLRQMTNVAVSVGTASTGFGYGGVVSGNVISGNTSVAPTTYGIFSQGGIQQQISGNQCYGFANGTLSGRSINTCINMVTGTRNVVTGNSLVGSSNSQYAAADSGSFDEWSNNIITSVNNAFNATSSTGVRVHDNRFDTSTVSPTFTWLTGSIHWNNQFTTGAQRGTCVLAAGTCTVSTTEVQTGDIVQISRTLAGGTIGSLSEGTIASGASFVINSTSNTDTSTVYWVIIH